MEIRKTAEHGGGTTYHIFIPDFEVSIIKIHWIEADEMSKLGTSKKISDNLMALHILASKIEDYNQSLK